jgi:hypothetical protein
MNKRICAIQGDKIIESFESIKYCSLIFNTTVYEIKKMIENETKVQHPANLGEVTLKFESDCGDTSSNTENKINDDIQQLNSKVETMQKVIDVYDKIFYDLNELHDTKMLQLENENSRLKMQCNLMILYLNKIRRKIGFYIYEDYIMRENDGIRLKEKLENIINRIEPCKSDDEI